MRNFTLASLAVAALLLALPASGSALLPTPDSYLIKPARSLGGLNFTMTIHEALDEWGGRLARCTRNKGMVEYRSVTCGYDAREEPGEDGFGFPSSSASFTQVGRRDGTLTSIRIGGNDPSNEDSSINKMHTPEGIRLGSPLSMVPEEYPNAVAYDGETWYVYRVVGDVKYTTAFSAQLTSRISDITFSVGRAE